MRGIRAVFILALNPCVLPGAETVGDAATQLRLLMTEAAQCFDAGDYAGAEQRLSQAVRLTEKPGLEPEARVLSLGELAVAVQTLGRLNEARKLFLQALEVCESIPGKDRYCEPGVLGGLAAVHVDMREYAKAEPLLRRAVSIAEALKDIRALARLYFYLATVQHHRGNPGEAEASLRRALAFLEQSGERNIPLKTGMLINIAVIRLETGRAAGARPLLEQAIAELEFELGPVHPLLAKPWSNLAENLSVLGLHREALAAAAKARTIAESAFGPEHHLTARTLMQCADVLSKAGRRREAGRLEKRAREILARHERENLTGHTVDARAFQARARSGARRSAEPRR